MKYLRLLFFVAFLVFVKVGNCCDCLLIDEVSIEDVFETKYIFTGVVVNTYIDTIKYVSEIQENEYETTFLKTKIAQIEVERFYKGETESELVNVVTSDRKDGSCIIHFEIGDTWLIWTNDYNKSMFYASYCSRSTQTKTKGIELLEDYFQCRQRKKWYDSNNIMRAIGKNENGVPNGVWKFFYADGSLKAKGKYINGVRYGYWQYYYPNRYRTELGKMNNNGTKESILKTKEKWYQILYADGQMKKI